MAEIEAALAGLYEAVDRIADERRREPRQDLLTALVHASDADGDRLSPDELRANVAGLVFAGQDSTRGQLGLALEIFARHPEPWTRLTSEPELAEPATEEVMRATHRTCLSSIAGVRSEVSNACSRHPRTCASARRMTRTWQIS